MSARILLQLPLPPSANAYWRSAPGRGLVPSKAALVYKRVVRVLTAKTRPLAGSVQLFLRFAPFRGDLGNRLKVLEDALNGIAWLDDSQIDFIQMTKLGTEIGFVQLLAIGSKFHSESEVQADQLARARTNQKRRATLAKNRKGKLAVNLLSRAEAQAVSAEYRPHPLLPIEPIGFKKEWPP